MSQLRKIKKKIQHKDEERISQIITEFSADYLATAEDTQSRQSYLNCACTAWNLALFPDEEIEQKLKLLVEEYCFNNPGLSDGEEYRHNLRQLIARKKKHYNHIKLSVVDASILEQGKDIWIQVVSRPFSATP
ncbi:hypothetical protein [Desulfogranum mediterraneum]|uniref:hypothetical protein n=1 Tax=Desulfogranum mediterraneum TaxID=160661 RepID=UPI0012946BDE|nr:hypothetical protein [Desulfogranum mediterraneum]